MGFPSRKRAEVMESPSLYPNILIAVVVYNRVHNIQTWINAIQKIREEEKDYNAKFLVICNGEGNNQDKIESLCNSKVVDYFVRRDNIGYDIGSLQDLINGKYKLPYDWEFLHWAVDDTIPMNIDFISIYHAKLFEESVGIVGTELSRLIWPHLRTNSFYINRETAEKLVFPCHRVVSKEDCYAFEHHKKVCLKDQIESMGLKVVVAGKHNKLFWDTEHDAQANLMKTHKRVFNVEV